MKRRGNKGEEGQGFTSVPAVFSASTSNSHSERKMGKREKEGERREDSRWWSVMEERGFLFIEEP